MGSNEDEFLVVKILAPITALLAITVITYIVIKQRQLTRRMIESGEFVYSITKTVNQINKQLSLLILGQLVPVMPAVVTYQQYPQVQQQELRSPTTGKTSQINIYVMFIYQSLQLAPVNYVIIVNDVDYMPCECEKTTGCLTDAIY